MASQSSRLRFMPFPLQNLPVPIYALCGIFVCPAARHLSEELIYRRHESFKRFKRGITQEVCCSYPHSQTHYLSDLSNILPSHQPLTALFPLSLSFFVAVSLVWHKTRPSPRIATSNNGYSAKSTHVTQKGGRKKKGKGDTTAPSRHRIKRFYAVLCC